MYMSYTTLQHTHHWHSIDGVQKVTVQVNTKVPNMCVVLYQHTDLVDTQLVIPKVHVRGKMVQIVDNEPVNIGDDWHWESEDAADGSYTFLSPYYYPEIPPTWDDYGVEAYGTYLVAAVTTLLVSDWDDEIGWVMPRVVRVSASSKIHAMNRARKKLSKLFATNGPDERHKAVTMVPILMDENWVLDFKEVTRPTNYGNMWYHPDSILED